MPTPCTFSTKVKHPIKILSGGTGTMLTFQVDVELECKQKTDCPLAGDACSWKKTKTFTFSYPLELLVYGCNPLGCGSQALAAERCLKCVQNCLNFNWPKGQNQDRCLNACETIGGGAIGNPFEEIIPCEGGIESHIDPKKVDKLFEDIGSGGAQGGLLSRQMCPCKPEEECGDGPSGEKLWKLEQQFLTGIARNCKWFLSN